MKVLGISFGRRNQRSDVMVKEALFAAKAAGAEVQFINTVRMDIGHCRACDYCSRMRDKGETEIHCCMKDDYHILEEACLLHILLFSILPAFFLSPLPLLYHNRYGDITVSPLLLHNMTAFTDQHKLYALRQVPSYMSP